MDKAILLKELAPVIDEIKQLCDSVTDGDLSLEVKATIEEMARLFRAVNPSLRERIQLNTHVSDQHLAMVEQVLEILPEQELKGDIKGYFALHVGNLNF